MQPSQLQRAAEAPPGTVSRNKGLHAFQARYRRVNDVRLRRYGIVVLDRVWGYHAVKKGKLGRRAGGSARQATGMGD